MHGAVHAVGGFVKVGATSTTNRALPTRPEDVHVIVVVPAETAVATPVAALTVAKAGLLLAQPEDVQAGVVLPWLSVKTAVKGTVVPTAAPMLAGVTVSELATKM